MGFHIEQGGLLTTIQDGGRIGFQQFGIPQSGAADRFALACANLLVDNNADEAALELTVIGPRLVFDAANVIAISGANLSPRLNGADCPMQQAIAVKQGDVLSFGACRSGCRSYIAFAGGLDIPPVMGSRSTYLKAALGGVDGRGLRPGDAVAFLAPRQTLSNMSRRRLPATEYNNDILIRAVPGPQEDHFTKGGRERFWTSEYTVTQPSDRMGCRLSGAVVEHIGDGNIISDGVTFGSIQIPESGQPIVMLADRQTVGGYAKIATIISADLPLISQCKGGEKIRFSPVTVEQGQALYLQQQKQLQAMSALWAQAEHSQQDYRIVVDGTAYDVTVSRCP